MRFKASRLAVALFAVFVTLALLPSPKAFAQNVYGTIRGTVTDPSGAVVPGANVEIRNEATGVVTKLQTDSQGTFVFPEVQPGTYDLTIAASGFMTNSVKGIEVNVNTIRQENIELKIGSSQTVQVQAAGIQIETSDTQLKTTYQSQAIENLPLLGRNVVALQKDSPGVVESSDRFGTFSTDGSQTAANAFLLDGADINDAPLQGPGITPNPDALSEFQVVVSTLNPEYSRNSGAIVLEQLKTGTNQFHGDAFEFYRDAGLDTRNYFSLKPSPLHQNVYGGTLGGPVFKNKLFFFLAYQGLRNSTSVTQQTTVFSNAQRQGNFGTETLSNNPIPFNVNGCVANGTLTWAQCFANSPNGVVINPSEFNSISAKLLQQFVPQRNNGQYYRFQTADGEGSDQGIIRIDYHPEEHDILWASSIFQSNPDHATLPFVGATLPGFGMVDSRHTKIFNASWTHIFNSTTVNELRANYYRFVYAAVSPQQVVQPSSYGFDITPQSKQASLPYMGVQGYFTLGFSADGPQPRNDQTLVGTDNLSKVIGNHNMRFGVQVQRYTVNNPFYFVNNGYYGFDPSATYSSGDPAIDFLMGVPSFYEQSSGGVIDARAWEIYAYGQDNWKVSDTLTLNYGSGYDVETPYANLQFGGNAIVCYTNTDYQSKAFPGVPGLKYPTDPGCNNAGGPTTKYTHLAPRVGFAWAPKAGPKVLVGEPGTESFSVRGGFGVYYNRDQEEGALQNLLDPPFGLVSFGYSGGDPAFANPFASVTGTGSEPNPFPFKFPTPGSGVTNAGVNYLDISTLARNNTVPTVYNYNLNIQRALPGQMILQIGYVGSLGRHLVITYESDPITPAGHQACLNDPTCVANSNLQHIIYPDHASNPRVDSGGNPYYISVGTQATEGVSNYNSLQVQLTKRPSNGLYFTLAYTYSHALDNGSGLESSGFNGHGYNQYPGYSYLNYGDSDFDARQRFVAVYEYQIPIGSRLNRNYLTRLLLGGWNLGGITTLQTGFPVNITDTGQFNSLWCDQYSFYSCPDTPVTSNFRIPTKVAAANQQGFDWMDTSVFSQEKVGYFGNVKRGILHGPGYNYTNMDILKNFYLNKLDRKMYVQLRLEAYNVFNHPNFAMPDGNFTDGPGNFGVISSVIQPGINGDPQPGRTVQIAGKFFF